MTKVTIEYCVPCGLLDSAIDTERALLEEFGQEIDEVRLRTGHGGVFKIHVDDETVFDKDGSGGKLALPEIKNAVQKRTQTPA
jgi:selenoprotein W-related protein